MVTNLRGWFLIGGVALLVFGAVSYYIWAVHQEQGTEADSSLLQAKVPAVSPLPGKIVVSAITVNGSKTDTTEPIAASPFEYNAQGQLEKITYPDGSTYVCAYDVHGDKIRETDRTGKTWNYVYDEQQHPLKVVDPEGRVSLPASSSGQN